MRTIFAIIEDEDGQVTGALVGTNPDSLQTVTLADEDVCPRSELPFRATALCAKYALQPSVLMLQALAAVEGSSTPPPPSQ